MNITPLHMGALHPMEQALTLVLAFGPFVVLGVVILVRRRQDRASAATADPSGPPEESLRVGDDDVA